MDSMSKEELTAFWDEKSKTFPRYEHKEKNYESGMLDIIRGMGVEFKGAHVLDVGCGSGMYTIRIAKEALSVTATDISGGMLRVLTEDAEANGVNNITAVQTDWAVFVQDRKYDVVFCSMSPAAHTDEGRQKLTDCTLKHAVYMGFAGTRDSDVLGGLCEIFGIAQKDFSDAHNMRAWLEKNGYAYEASPVNGEWVETRNFEETLRNTRGMLKTHDIEADDKMLGDYLQKFRNEDGAYVERTKYLIEIIIWRP